MGSCGCSRKPVTTGKGNGAEAAQKNSWGWVVSLQYRNNHFCSGSVLNERYIITAAHCFDKKLDLLSYITVCAGTYLLSSTCRQRRSVLSVFNHPDYNQTTFENDIALIRVDISFNFTDTSIAHTCLPIVIHNVEYPEAGKRVMEIGWGKTGTSNRPDALQQVTLQVVHQLAPTCSSFVSNHSIRLCAAAAGKKTCNGDSGAPLMAFTTSKRWELVGLTSSGIGCTKGRPNVYTRISAFRTFIQKTITQTSFSANKIGYDVITSPDGGRYEGQVKGSQKHSNGTYYYANGNNYTGAWVDDKQTGYGVFTWSHGDRYEGQFKNGKKHGKGTCCCANGNYTGDWVDDKISGQGVMTWTDGRKYEGEWLDGQRHGNGTNNYRDGRIYTGGWINNNRSARGSLVWPDGARYDGDWTHDYKHGSGTMYYADGGTYTGSWMNDTRSGRGVMITSNGDKYDGDWLNEKRSGQGIFIWTDGDRYDGDWREGKRNGSGKMEYADGRTYIGEWLNNKRSGHGVMTWSDGRNYTGGWVNDTRSGLGDMTWPDGRTCSSNWTNDKAVCEGT